MVTGFGRWSTSSPAKASHAQLDTKAHQVVIQCGYMRNEQDKPISRQGSKENSTSNGANRNMLALPPRVLIGRSTLDNVDQGPIMIAFRNETDAAHYKTYGINFRRDHCYARDSIETRRISTCLNCRELTHQTCSCSRKSKYVLITLHQHRTPFGRPRMLEGYEMPARQHKVCQLQRKPRCERPRLLGVVKTKGTAPARGTHATQGVRNEHAVNLEGLAKPVEESQKAA